MKIKMKETVRPDWPFNFRFPDTLLEADQIYEAIRYEHGAVCGICENGELLGVKPGEFEIIESEEECVEDFQIVRFFTKL